MASSPDTIAAAPGWTPDAQLRLAAEVLAPELQQDAAALIDKASHSSLSSAQWDMEPGKGLGPGSFLGCACISRLHSVYSFSKGVLSRLGTCPQGARVSTAAEERPLKWLAHISDFAPDMPAVQVHQLQTLLPGTESSLRRIKPAQLVRMAAKLEQVRLLVQQLVSMLLRLRFRGRIQCQDSWVCTARGK
jgi:hypothetical protein